MIFFLDLSEAGGVMGNGKECECMSRFVYARSGWQVAENMGNLIL